MPSRKYVLDPSVSSNPYGAPTRNVMPTQSFQPNSYSNSTYNYNQDPQSAMMPNQVPNVNPSPLVANFNTNPAALLNPISQVPTPPSYTSNQGFPPQAVLENAQPTFNSFSSNTPSGWNDPPVLNKAPKTQVIILLLSQPDVGLIAEIRSI